MQWKPFSRNKGEQETQTRFKLITAFRVILINLRNTAQNKAMKFGILKYEMLSLMLV